MASIAYITDQRMIEYHRLNGNTNFIFWRPTSQKNFSNFNFGDYLFFLAKGTEKGQEKEKGIIGYGKFIKDYELNVKEMWRKFKTKTGSENENQLFEAIKKVAKRDCLPDKMHCLELDAVVFFQTPVYLSELGVHISKQIESYIYIDHEDVFSSSKIIRKASSYGKDMWSTMILNHNENFEQDGDIILIRNINQKYACESFSDYEKKKYSQFITEFMNPKVIDYVTVNSMDFYHKSNEKLSFYIPCMLTIQNSNKKLLNYIGKYQFYVSALNHIKSEAYVYLLLDKEIDENLKIILVNLNIKYICSS